MCSNSKSSNSSRDCHSTTAAPAEDKPVRVRGEITGVDGQIMMVKSRDGDELKIKLADNVGVSGIVKIGIEDVKPNSYIGASTMPQPDGSQRALHVHIFPEPMRGTAEGHFRWDVRPQSMMTNATVMETWRASMVKPSR